MAVVWRSYDGIIGRRGIKIFNFMSQVGHKNNEFYGPYAMLWYVMICYVMLCYVMLCYLMLCYVMVLWQL